MKTNLNKWLFRPFEYVSDYRALIIGFIIILLSGALNIAANSHFDGILDIHFGGQKTNAFIYLYEGIVDWLLFSLLLFIAGLTFSPSSIRFIDVFGTQALARAPLVLASLSVLVVPHKAIDESLVSKISGVKTELHLDTYQILLFALLSLIVIAVTIWTIILMYRAYSISCNLKGNKGVIIFIAALLVAEIISKFLTSLSI